MNSLEEIARQARDLGALEGHGRSKTPSRADLLVEREEGTPEIRAWLVRAAADGYKQLQSELAAIREKAERRQLDLNFVDRVRILLALRANSDWLGMVNFSKWADANGQEPQPSFTSIPEVGQQYAMALNRLGDPEHINLAEQVLEEIIRNYGGDSETFGILGRVYKDRWWERRSVDPLNEFLVIALNAYWVGLQRNPSEIYPAINALTLLRIAGYKPDALSGLASHIYRLLDERFKSRKVDYFDYASRIEFHAAVDDSSRAWDFAKEAIDHVREVWELETTAQNLLILSTAVSSAGDVAQFLKLQAKQRKTLKNLPWEGDSVTGMSAA